MDQNTQVVVAVTNRHPSKTFSSTHLNVTYRIEPGQTIAVPYDAIRLWFGDPKARNGGPDNPKLRDRTKEVDRLSARYATYNASWFADGPAMTNMLPGEPADPEPYELHDGGYRHPNLPLVEVREFGTNNRIVTVIDDPDGDVGKPTPEADAEKGALEAGVRQLQAQMQQMMQALAVKDPALAASFQAQGMGGVPSGNEGGGLAEMFSSDGELADDPVAEPTARATVDESPATRRARVAKR